MSQISERLKELGYRKFIESDDYSSYKLKDLSELISRNIPEQFTFFLQEFPNTGIFDDFVDVVGLESAPWAPDKRYPITGMYANCSRSHLDIMKIRDGNGGAWDEFLMFGHDIMGGTYAIDLRSEEFGKIKYKSTEEDWDGMINLIANDFFSFIFSIQLSN